MFAFTNFNILHKSTVDIWGMSALRNLSRAQPNGWIGSGEGSAMRTGREEVGPGQRISHQGAAQRLDRFRDGYHGWAHIKGNPKLKKMFIKIYCIIRFIIKALIITIRKFKNNTFHGPKSIVKNILIQN